MDKFLRTFGVVFSVFGGLVLLVAAGCGWVYLQWYYLDRFIGVWTLIPQALWIAFLGSIVAAFKLNTDEETGG